MSGEDLPPLPVPPISNIVGESSSLAASVESGVPLRSDGTPVKGTPPVALVHPIVDTVPLSLPTAVQFDQIAYWPARLAFLASMRRRLLCFSSPLSAASRLLDELPAALATPSSVFCIPPYVLLHDAGACALAIAELSVDAPPSPLRWATTLHYASALSDGAAADGSGGGGGGGGGGGSGGDAGGSGTSSGSRGARHRSAHKLDTGSRKGAAVFGNGNWLVVASSARLAVWDWDALLAADGKAVAPSRSLTLSAHAAKGARADVNGAGGTGSESESAGVSSSTLLAADDLHVVLEPLSELCRIDRKCRVVLASRRSLLVYDVPKKQELFRYNMTLSAPDVGPFRDVAFSGSCVATIEQRGLRLWPTGSARGIAPVIAPDVAAGEFTSVTFRSKSKVIVGDALGRLRLIGVDEAQPLMSVAALAKAKLAARQLPAAVFGGAHSDDDELTGQRAPMHDDSDDDDGGGGGETPYGTMPNVGDMSSVRLNRSLTLPTLRAPATDEMGVFAELVRSASLSTLKVAVRRKLPNQLADLRQLRDARQRTALHIAAERNRVETARYLIRKSDAVWLNAHDNLGRTALHAAATAQASEVCRLLLRGGARAAQRDVRGATPMHALVQRRWPKRATSKRSLMRVSDALRSAIASDDLPGSGSGGGGGGGSRVESVNDDELLSAAALSRATAAELRLLSASDAGDSDATTASTSVGAVANSAHKVTSSDVRDQLTLVSLLSCFAALVGIDARDAEESTPLMVACNGDNVEAVRVLLYSGADWQIARANGDTALHVAVRASATNSCALLVAHGASIHLPNRHGESAWALAMKMGNVDLQAALQPIETNDKFSGGSGGGGGASKSVSAVLGLDDDSSSGSSRRSSKSHIEAMQSARSERRASQNSARAASPTLSGSGTVKRSFRAKLASKLGRGTASVDDVASETKATWMAAANAGSIDELKVLQKKIGSVAFLLRDKHEQTALHRAAFRGHTAAVAWLAGHRKAPADYVHSLDKNGWTPMHGAASSGHMDTIGALLDCDADVTRQALPENGGATPLHYAVRIPWKAPTLPNLLTRMITAAGIGPAFDLVDADGASIVLVACYKGARETVAFLLGKKKTAMEAVDGRGESALHYAARGNRASTIELLLRRGIELLRMSDANESAMDVAEQHGAADAVKALAAAADAKFGTSSSAAAVGSGGGGGGGGSSGALRRESGVGALKRAADTDAQVSAAALASEFKGLFEAAACGDLQRARAIVKQEPVRAFVATTAAHGRTVLHVAVANKQVELTTWLLAVKQRPASLVHRVDAQGLTPLHLATGSTSGSLKLAQLLVRCGSDAFCPAGSRHTTPLHELVCARWHGRRSATLLDELLGVPERDAKAGDAYVAAVAAIADADVKAEHKPPALDSRPVPRLEGGFSGFLDPRSASGATPLMLAAGAGNSEACLYLASRGARMGAADVVGDTAMHYAVRSGSADTVRVLLACGVSYKVRGNRDTPLGLAQSAGHKKIESVLRRHAERDVMARRNMRSSFRFIGKNDWRQLLTGGRALVSPRATPPASPSTSSGAAETATPSSLRPIAYLTSSAPSAVLHGTKQVMASGDSAAVDRVLVANDRVFMAQRGGALSVWDAKQRGAWRPLTAQVCNASAVLTLIERDGRIGALFAASLAHERRRSNSVVNAGATGALHSAASLASSGDYSAHLLPDEIAPVYVDAASGVSTESDSLSTQSTPEEQQLRALRQRGGSMPIAARLRDPAVAQTLRQRTAVDDAMTTSSRSLLDVEQSDADAELCKSVTALSLAVDFDASDKNAAAQKRIAEHELKRLKEVGHGAFGSVWYGLWNGAPVAIKEARGDANAANAALADEAQRLAELPPHANVLRLFGVCDSPLCIVTEYCSRGSLNALLYGKGKTDPLMVGSTLDRCVVDAALGLYHLHAHGVVHRDIAARNILVDSRYRAKVADFGMARVVSDDTNDYTMSTSGPLKWMAPEQLERRAFSTRSDVWSFGCFMYECYARRKPWDGYTNAAAVHKVLSAQRMAPPKEAPAVVAKLMRLCWHVKPVKRPTMANICTLLSAAVAQQQSDTDDYGDMLEIYPDIPDFEANNETTQGTPCLALEASAT